MAKPENRWPSMRIRDLRSRMGLTQPQFTNAINAVIGGSLHWGRIYKWERLGVRPHARYQAALDMLDRNTPSGAEVANGFDIRVME